MSYTTKQVVDAINADIQGLALPDHGTFLYADARMLRYDVKKSWLQIFPTVEVHDVVTTMGTYDNLVTICIEWTTQTFNGTESNIDDQPTAEQHLSTSDLIADRLRSYAAGVPGLNNVTAVVTEIKWDLKAAPAWFAQHYLKVELFKGDC